MNITSTTAATTPANDRTTAGRPGFPFLLVVAGVIAAGGCVRVESSGPGKDAATTNRFDDSPRSPSDSTNTLEPPTASEPSEGMRTISAGTGVSARLDTTLDSGIAKIGDEVRATTTSDVHDSSGVVVLPAGTVLTGQVTEVQAAQKIHKMASLSFRFERATLSDGRTADISASQGVDGKGWTNKQGAIIAGSAAGGAVLGQVLGDDTKSTVGGAIVGGAIATGVIMSHVGEDVVISSGSTMELTLDEDVDVNQPLAS